MLGPAPGGLLQTSYPLKRISRCCRMISVSAILRLELAVSIGCAACPQPAPAFAIQSAEAGRCSAGCCFLCAPAAVRLFEVLSGDSAAAEPAAVPVADALAAEPGPAVAVAAAQVFEMAFQG